MQLHAHVFGHGSSRACVRGTAVVEDEALLRGSIEMNWQFVGMNNRKAVHEKWE